MKEIDSKIIDSSVEKLLSYAMSSDNITEEYDKYISSINRKLYGFFLEDACIGCIGLEFSSLYNAEIKHIAVDPSQRGNKVASKMVDFVYQQYLLSTISAETDKEAVEFYKRYGFAITSLGEKYPGVERFQCIYQEKQ
ncbi:GNAT family N-acetyltransferase [Planococcus sp. NCCP-2050]|uniref:GNAT family N-acetyltransferase n=1 Tax=Planococcus sp. NCCP-2050 TaxID=2944679 RepID=UPI00203BD6C0|nr:GNAT family N-acetyltransferase [Planococcus sp. NCCP-2050]GKW46995.1 hypothetical protein NCCP2050_26870 [Planococcus sp. NCCP-2050]